MHTTCPQKKLAILINQIAPYRVPLYRELARVFDTCVFISGAESNRHDWDVSGSPEEPYRVKRSWGHTFKFRKLKQGRFFDYKFLHLNPGYFFDLARFRPDAVISIEMGFRSIAAIIYGMIFRKPVWIWWGGTLHTERAVGAGKRVVRAILARVVRRWISYGMTSTEYLLSIRVPRDRILQIQNCVDERLYSKPVPAKFDVSPKPVLLYVGQMIDRKGVEPLLEAASLLQKEGYVFSLLLVGNGPMANDYSRLAQELGLANTTFMPAVKPGNMPAVYRSASCLVFPTLEDVWGLVVNEALHSGIPVVSSVFAGCASEIVPREYQFNPLDIQDFCKTLKVVLSNKIWCRTTARLLPIREVAELIGDDIGRALQASGKEC